MPLAVFAPAEKIRRGGDSGESGDRKERGYVAHLNVCGRDVKRIGPLFL